MSKTMQADGQSKKLQQETLARAAAEKGIARLRRTAYRDSDPGVKETRKAKLPTAQVQSKEDIAKLIRQADKKLGIDRNKKPSAPVIAPDMHEEKKKLPGNIKHKGPVIITGLKIRWHLCHV